MLQMLGTLAEGRGLSMVELRFRPTARNAPAASFLRSLGAGSSPSGEAELFRLSTDEAVRALALPVGEAPMEDGDPRAATPAPGEESRAVASLLGLIPRELSTAEQIHAAVENDAAPPQVGATGTGSVPRNADAERHCELWRDVLRVDSIGIHDGFFDLGGDSIMAVQLFTRIRREFGVLLHPTVLLETPTIAALAARLTAPAESDGDAARWTSLVPIQTGGTRPPLFCLHAGAGTILFYRPLASALGPDQPVYALQAQGLYDGEKPHASVE